MENKQRLEYMKTGEYKQEQAKRLEKIRSLRNKSTIETSDQYMAMINGVCGEKRIKSRQKIDRLRAQDVNQNQNLGI